MLVSRLYFIYCIFFLSICDERGVIGVFIVFFSERKTEALGCRVGKNVNCAIRKTFSRKKTENMKKEGENLKNQNKTKQKENTHRMSAKGHLPLLSCQRHRHLGIFFISVLIPLWFIYLWIIFFVKVTKHERLRVV